VRTITAGERLPVERGDAVVCVPVYGALDLARACLESIARHTDPGVTVLVADDASPGDVDALVAGLDVVLMRQPQNAGFVENANAAMRAAAPADVVLVNSDVVVAEGWLDGLRDAAASDSRIATVSALSDVATIASVAANGRDVDDVAARVRAGSLRLRPRVPTAIGHCVLVTRAALDLVGQFDPAFSPGYGEEVDFSQRCLARGMVHVLADDVWVAHRGRASFGEAEALREEHERLIERRWPSYHPAVRAAMNAERGALPDALAAARRSLRALTVTIDGGGLGPYRTGTNVSTMGPIRGLAGRDDVKLRVALPDGVAPEIRDEVDALGAERISMSDVERGVERSDVVHRPAQVVAPKDLDRLHRLGERIVITQQDLIAYANPTYFSSFGDWDALRRVTRQSLELADATVFLSEAVRADAIARELVPPERASVVHQGVAHDTASGRAQPPGVDGLGDATVLLCVGADFRHKNNAFAIRVQNELRDRGVDTVLILAGPQMAHGSSLDDERAAERDGSRVIRLRDVSEDEKAWLYDRADLVLYPTLSEGFGQIPFEAARAGTACMFAPVSALPEVVGAGNATIVPWDAAATAERALELLRDEAKRRALAEAIGARGREYTWERNAERLVALYGEVVRRPVRPARAAYFGDALSDVALSLVGPGGALPDEVQRALQAIAARPALRRPAFAALEASYRALRRSRRAGR
jgi:glycosyltransferase involved in cell wall biosynthesis